MRAVRRDLDRDAFDRAISEFRFDDAARLLEDVDPALSDELNQRLERARGKAEEAAQSLYLQITRHGADEEYAEVLALGRHPSTDDLLALLPKSGRRHAEAYLGAATRWEAAKKRTSQRRLAESHRALAEFDLQLARGLAHRVEREFLEDEEDLDRLILDIESRAMELESLREAQRSFPGGRTSPERPSSTDKRPWWRRWRS